MRVEMTGFVLSEPQAQHKRENCVAKRRARSSGSPTLGSRQGIPSGVLPSRSYELDRAHHLGSQQHSVVSVRSSIQDSLPRLKLRDSRKRVRPRANRDITVPRETDVTSAISLYDIPSSSRSTSASRNTSGSSSSARRKVSLSARASA